MKRQKNVTTPQLREHILDIPLSQLLPDPNQPRKKFRRIEELAASIKSQGLQQLPVVDFAYMEDGKKFYYIRAGERRFRAHQRNGAETMRCVVKGAYDGKRSIMRRLAQAAENFAREEHTHGELIELVEEVVRYEVEKRGTTHGSVDIALGRVTQAFGFKNRNTATQYHTLAGLLPKLREMLDEDEEDKRLNFGVAVSLARAPADTQLAILKQAEAKFAKGGHAAGHAFIVRRVREIREERGERIRGRAFDDKLMFIRTTDRLLKLAQGLYGERRAAEYKEYIHMLLERMSSLQVDVMLNQLTQGVQAFSALRELVLAKRNQHYKHLSVVR